MPNLDFPSSPSVGQVVALSTTNLRWSWDGVAWRRVVQLAIGLSDVVEGFNAIAVSFVVYTQAV